LKVGCYNDKQIIESTLLFLTFKNLGKQYHGGTNFGRSSGGPFITTSYDYDAPLDEYGETKCNK